MTLEMIKQEERQEGIAIGFDEGVAVGRDEGISIGRNEGITIGRNEGINIGAEQVARSMLRRGYDLTEISELTGLSLERVQELEKER